MKKQKEPSESYTFRIPTALRQELQRQADDDGRALANYIISLLRKAVLKK